MKKWILGIAVAVTIALSSGSAEAVNQFPDANRDGHVDVLDIGIVVAEFGNASPLQVGVETYIVIIPPLVGNAAIALCDAGDEATGGGWTGDPASQTPAAIIAEKPLNGGWKVLSKDPLVLAIAVCSDNIPLRTENDK